MHKYHIRLVRYVHFLCIDGRVWLIIDDFHTFNITKQLKFTPNFFWNISAAGLKYENSRYSLEIKRNAMFYSIQRQLNTKRQKPVCVRFRPTTLTFQQTNSLRTTVNTLASYSSFLSISLRLRSSQMNSFILICFFL